MQFTSAFRNLLLALVMGGTPLASFAQVAVGVGVSINVAPPPLPVYSQPPCPADGEIWVPGYWAYSDDGYYYWVPGYWTDPPEVGFYWTPGYWAYSDGFYAWHAGYWGPDVGFYGGIDYGFGYGGIGYYGGRWEGGTFYYNTAVTNVNRSIVHNTYVDRSNHMLTSSRASFNGAGGVSARPTAQQRVAMRERHIQATTAQMAHQQTAAKNRNRMVSVNRGHPTRTAVTTTGRHPTAVTTTGRHPTAVTTTGRHPTAVTTTGRHPAAVTTTGRHPTAVTTTGRHPTVNPSRTSTSRVAASTRGNTRVETAKSRTAHVSTTSGANRVNRQSVHQARTVHVSRAATTPVAQTHRTVHNQPRTQTAAVHHTAPARQNRITQTSHAPNPVAFERQTPAQHAPAPARHASTPTHRNQPQSNQKHGDQKHE
jgi:hypothetical protein